MACECSIFTPIVRLEDHPRIEKDSEELESGNWVRLHRCRSCGQLWSIDEWDKYSKQFAIKIPRQEGWREFDTKALRLEFLVASRGGLAFEKCIWTDCDNYRVKGTAVCAEHLAKAGAQE